MQSINKVLNIEIRRRIETYYRRFRGHEAPGKGVDWEGALITQEIYDSHYKLISEAAYQNLYDFLLGQSGIGTGRVATRPLPGLSTARGRARGVATSADLFLKDSLDFFGDDADRAFAAGNAGAFEKGRRLARCIGARRALLILDGLEPLQYPPTSPTPGELKDQAIAALLKGLAAGGQGLCVVTTRYALPDLRAFLGNSVREEKAFASIHRRRRGIAPSLRRTRQFTAKP